jgi:hypothetical protein
MARRKVEIEVAVVEVVDYLRITGGFAPALREIIRRKLTAEAARKSGLKVTTKELQRAADAFRASLGLQKAKDTKAWLRGNGVSLEAFEDHLETNLLICKYKDKLVSKTPKKKYVASPAVQELVREMIYEDWVAKASA